ncbi:MAG: molybdenum cofactor guanylyltransferase [Deltaproteobacteria bacterium]|nr:molybdenum cofactor guanylyltransferase [Deltaproteobacteria bacterium]HDZ41603.1 molybdenum cofactor guanylyltransferase [Bacteroidota bacterium]
MEQPVVKYEFTAAILAGGKNTRFSGKTKAKLVIEGVPIIERTIKVLKSVFDEIIIITNNEREFSDYKNIRMAGDIYNNIGPLGGLHSALTNTDRDAVFLVASDMPGLSVSAIRAVARNFKNIECEVLIPVYNGLIEPLHAIYSKTILPRLDDFIKSGKKYSIRKFLKLVDDKYLVIEGESMGVNPFLNINSPEDLHKCY